MSEDTETDAPVGEFPSELEALAAEVYRSRARSGRDMTPERWAYIKRTFSVSARSCIQEAQDILDGEYGGVEGE